MLKKAGAKNIIVSNDPKVINKATKIILPGVGSFDKAMSNLKKMNLIEPLKIKALDEKVPFLGICLGMQIMTNKSEEGQLPGLGFVNGQCRRFLASEKIKVPHMGWNKVELEKNSKLLKNVSEFRFYFVHSYFVELNDDTNTLLSTNYGSSFSSAFEVENLIGVQFHPEKSHRYGLELFKNFVERY